MGRHRKDKEAPGSSDYVGRHSDGIRSPRDFRARSGRTARDAYESMMERLRWEHRVNAQLALMPCH